MAFPEPDFVYHLTIRQMRRERKPLRRQGAAIAIVPAQLFVDTHASLHFRENE
jgi:hypothetical protein